MLQIEVITDLATEPVTLVEAKAFLAIDFADFDTLITTLIKSARLESERVTGKAYGAKLIQVTGNTYTDNTGEVVKIYPVTPFVSTEVWADESANTNYQYNAGFTTCPEDLKTAILMRVATGFAYRENGIAEAVRTAVNASIVTERRYVSQLCS